MHSNLEEPGRFHLLLASDGRTVQHGWWNSERTALRKFSIWVGERGTMPGASVSPTSRAATR
ncbi:hypothetical protein ACN6LA_007930 [Streptomyces sp. SAS_269]|uniref:hypothetical protein n=1 Tax=Streptomyces sp. SAS_269 TaxID=3412749 RepID=UPI00403C9EEF